jgi:hypothetical protein
MGRSIVACARGATKTDRFYRPCRDGRVFCVIFPALRTGLLSSSPFLLRPSGYGGQAGTIPLRKPASIRLTRIDPPMALAHAFEPPFFVPLSAFITTGDRVLPAPSFLPIRKPLTLLAEPGNHRSKSHTVRDFPEY